MTVDGRRRRVRLGTDRAGWTMVAKRMVALEEQLAMVRAGTWRAPDEPDTAVEADDPTFRAFASSWLEDSMLEWRPNTVNDVRWRLQSHLLPKIGEDRLSTFDIPRVTAVKTAMLRESRRIADAIDAGVIERDAHNNPLRPLSNESINKCMALLARILDDAVERGYLADNPARRVRRLRHHRPRRPVLQDHELNAMLHAADRLDLRRADLASRCPGRRATRPGRRLPQIADQLRSPSPPSITASCAMRRPATRRLLPHLGTGAGRGRTAHRRGMPRTALRCRPSRRPSARGHAKTPPGCAASS